MRTARLCLTLAALMLLPGCGYLVCGYHNAAAWTSRQWSAEKAWRVRKWMYADIPNRGSFKSGFKAGYRFACGGYDSCEPPQYRHYWRIGGLTETERQNAQAWSDGFTHGTVAAQQDHSVTPSALDTAAMQPPPGVPDVQYLNPPQMPAEADASLGGMYQYVQNGPTPQYWQNGSSPRPYEEQAPPGYGPSPMSQNYQFAPGPQSDPNAPSGGANPYAPPMPIPAPASEAMPMPPSPAPSSGSPLPPPAPASAPAAAAEYFPTRMMVSEAYPGVGSLGSVANVQPAPPAEPLSQPIPQTIGPAPQATQAAEWEMPVLRN